MTPRGYYVRDEKGEVQAVFKDPDNAEDFVNIPGMNLTIGNETWADGTVFLGTIQQRLDRLEKAIGELTSMIEKRIPDPNEYPEF